MSEWIAPTRKTFVAGRRSRIFVPRMRLAARFGAERNLLFLAIDLARSAPFYTCNGK
jgi:hypothetical protein